MLDVNEILQEAEDLLEVSYTQWQVRQPGQVQVYEAPQRQPETPQGQATPPNRPASTPPATQKPNLISELVANAFVLLLLTVLTDRPAHQ